MDDSETMQLALDLASRVEGRTSPRPPVGAVVVRDGEIVGQGATAPPFGPHAEIEALTAAGPATRGATLYVTLEPCCVTIHTPPCTDAIIAAGIQRLVVGTLDPNPLVAGRGLQQLRAMDIAVHCLDSEAAALLVRPFATFITQQRPYVTAKWAMTLDGKLATHTGDARWISGPQSRALVHDLRDRVDAILIGARTASIDNPQLTARLSSDISVQMQRTRRSGPLRVILATHGQLPDHLALLQPALAAGTWIIVGETCSPTYIQALKRRGVRVCPVAVDDHHHIDIAAALELLAQQGYMHVLMEGGSHILGSAFECRCVDHVMAFIAPKIIGGSSAPSPVGGSGKGTMSEAWELCNSSIQQFGDDVLIRGDVKYI
ncbi:bifunctional diaminohydroxyphosphoribosylaminopyrimidine deaminase/5-amino-6-(5-phosphoribosylamino)uracil reductase RibD [Dictyobacter formicarum]|uniref:Riboflavin biosynthesis protein RibD n=1 Tax=Dictyobacter formicarum TaxID=2778368 RepID=A0ABQ3VAB0_9CHLR|nr:bifunctional diaminohydroxyphosphoribosylaminopyrimidine deaminase/5-amino-6-(5-phosphoribosylamino)uracil reductase RibD [Dictyobacter formicarum]GHO82774.1 riboflavin biosynthesis protein RibD [Dictyobacter formicarum]